MSICKGKILFSILLASVIMCLQFSMQEEDIIKHINGKCHVCFRMQEEVIIEHTNGSVICVDFLVNL